MTVAIARARTERCQAVYDASAGSSASRRPKAGRRSGLSNARNIAQTD